MRKNNAHIIYFYLFIDCLIQILMGLKSLLEFYVSPMKMDCLKSVYSQTSFINGSVKAIR